MHFYRTSFCLSPSRYQWLSGVALQLKVMSDNGADVFINGAQVLEDAASNHDPVYWNSVVNLLSSSFVSGGLDCLVPAHDMLCSITRLVLSLYTAGC